MPIYLYIILAVIVLLVLWVIAAFNGFVLRDKRAQEAWSDIDVQLKRRYDLIPNLIEAVKGYVKHESSVFQKVTEARAAAMGAHSVGEHAKSENMLTDALKSLFAVAENYPDLKASHNFLRLQDELSDTENKIQAARRFHNGNVRDFNTMLHQFPANIIGGIFRFKEKEFFEISEAGEREAPAVKF